ncbi:MAG TPA: Na+ dependent nucleoside transporter N-terminal domain-containing protein, partial [Gemmatimonadales bacterium]|nr:Na+ dependent nucleoside transporter N-terminal domain-containing protein [Gemmatimonadales bacterium]
MTWRRVVLAFGATFLCSLLVFTLPRAVWNTLHAQTPASSQATAAPAPAPQTPAPTTAPRSIPQRLTGLIGMVVILGIGILFSRNRKAISWRVVGWGLGLQFAFAVFVLQVTWGRNLFSWLGAVATKLLGFSYAGSEFVFGEIGKQHSSIGVVFAFQILPTIIFVSALFAIMYYLGIMQVVVKAFAIM